MDRRDRGQRLALPDEMTLGVIGRLPADPGVFQFGVDVFPEKSPARLPGQGARGQDVVNFWLAGHHTREVQT